jgi:hypothetical protein
MPDFESLLGQAIQIAAKAYNDVQIGHVTAMPTTGGAQQASDFTQLHYVFLQKQLKSYVTLDCSNGQFGQPVFHSGMWVGDQFLSPPFAKSLDAAIGILRAGNYKQPIARLDLTKPVYPGVKEPMYLFAFGISGSRIGVGADTGTLTTG